STTRPKAQNIIAEPPPFVEPQSEAQLLEIRAIKKWMFKQKEAKSRGIDFELSVEEMKELIQKNQCYYSGIELKHYEDEGGDPPPDQFTIDRVDNKLGYVKGNVVPCSYEVNAIKSAGDAETIELRLNRLRDELERTLKNLDILLSKRDNLSTQVRVLETVLKKLQPQH